MTTYSVEETIAASPEAVWALLTDGSSIADWNTTIVSFEGDIVVGNGIKLVSTVNPKRAFKLNVAEMKAPHRMVWSDGMPLGLFKGVRTFTLSSVGDGSTRFEMVEEYSGLLEPLISRSIPDMTDSFREFAASLKQAAEAGS
ncbi:MAG: SRPBCC domain-containing protein [Acidimicrobiia bacterium]|nr:SRPBCC domain-containing protein [Acidimicrobiia bacterium]